MLKPIYICDWGTISVELPTEDYAVGAMNNSNTLFLHCRQEKWSKSIYKEMLDVFTIIVDDCYQLGYKNLASIVNAIDDNANKFQSLFGLKQYATLDEGSKVVYRMEIN